MMDSSSFSEEHGSIDGLSPVTPGGNQSLFNGSLDTPEGKVQRRLFEKPKSTTVRLIRMLSVDEGIVENEEEELGWFLSQDDESGEEEESELEGEERLRPALLDYFDPAEERPGQWRELVQNAHKGVKEALEDLRKLIQIVEDGDTSQESFTLSGFDEDLIIMTRTEPYQPAMKALEEIAANACGGQEMAKEILQEIRLAETWGSKVNGGL